MADQTLLDKVKFIMYGAGPKLMDTVTKMMFGYDSKMTATGKPPDQIDLNPKLPDTLGFAQEHVAFTFGRFSVPSTGHSKLLERLQEEAGEGPHIVFATHSHDSVKNPLSYQTKLAFMEMCWPNVNIYEGENVRTLFDAIEYLEEQGYKSATLVVGQDRLIEFRSLLSQYADKIGLTIGVVGVDRTDEDVSATKMRDAVLNEDFETFASMVPSEDDVLKKALYMPVQENMLDETSRRSWKTKSDYARQYDTEDEAKQAAGAIGNGASHFAHPRGYYLIYDRHGKKMLSDKSPVHKNLKEQVTEIMNRVPTAGEGKEGTGKIGDDSLLKNQDDGTQLKRRKALKRFKQAVDII